MAVAGGGMVAAGHPETARAGAEVLRAGGNAVDAAIAAMLASFTAEPLLTGLGAGGYLLAAGFDPEPVALDFFVAAPGLGGSPADSARAGARRDTTGGGSSGGTGRAGRAPLLPIDVSFGDAVQTFNVGAASVGTWGVPAGICAAMDRWGSVPLVELTAPAARTARDGVALNAAQAYVFEILAGILTSTPEAAALFAPGGRVLREGDRFRWADLGDDLERLGAQGAAPFYTGDVARTVVAWLQASGSVLGQADLDAYRATEREPVRVAYRGRTVLTNPPPSAGGLLIAAALAGLGDGAPTPERLIAVMAAVQAGRTPAFVEGLDEPGFAGRFLASRLGSTTHISVVDDQGRACAVTCTNGEGCGVVVPGTGVHPNNIMGEEDLNPLGFHAFAPGRRMPSMMAPTVVLAPSGGGVELVLGSAGSNRIRSAILQTIVGVVDEGLDAEAAVTRPRLHLEEDTVYAEPGFDAAQLAATGHAVVDFREPNLFFGGVQAVQRDPASGRLSGAGDPRRGGVAMPA